MIDTSAINKTFDLLGESEKVTSLNKISHCEGGEWAGPCPICGGDDRYRVQPSRSEPRWLCRNCTDGKWRDGIAWVMKVHNLDFKAAVERMGGKIEPEDPLEVIRRETEKAERIQQELEASIEHAQAALDDLRKACKWLNYHEQLEHDQQARQLWRGRGIPDVYQDLMQFGYDARHQIYVQNEPWVTPTLTIPVFELGTRQCLNIRHRLLNPKRSGDKYRPELSGLPASLWIADPDLVNPDYTLIVEGEIKAAVCYITADDPNLQTIGTPGKNTRLELIQAQIQNDGPVFICYDPDARSNARELAASIGKRARVITLPEKIDDLIIKYNLDKGWMRETMRQATKGIM